MKITLKLTWVRQTDRSHIYSLKFPGRARSDTIAIPKFDPNPDWCLPTTKPPRELEVTINELGEAPSKGNTIVTDLTKGG